MGDDMAAAAADLRRRHLVFAFRPEGEKWRDYLDQIWSAYEKAEGLYVSVLVARFRTVGDDAVRPTLADHNDGSRALLRLRHVIDSVNDLRSVGSHISLACR
jgi:hypothetical protein